MASSGGHAESYEDSYEENREEDKESNEGNESMSLGCQDPAVNWTPQSNHRSTAVVKIQL